MSAPTPKITVSNLTMAFGSYLVMQELSFTVKDRKSVV